MRKGEVHEAKGKGNESAREVLSITSNRCGIQ